MNAIIVFDVRESLHRSFTIKNTCQAHLSKGHSSLLNNLAHTKCPQGTQMVSVKSWGDPSNPLGSTLHQEVECINRVVSSLWCLERIFIYNTPLVPDTGHLPLW